jgi:LysM repeat protein
MHPQTTLVMHIRREGPCRVTLAARSRRLCIAVLLTLYAGLAQAQIQRTYTVRAGDTLYRIAVTHNLTVEQLQALNGLEGTTIKVGQMLRLTDGSGSDTGSARPDSVIVREPDPAPTETQLVGEPPPATPPPAEPPPVGPSVRPTTITAVTDSAGTILYGEYQAGEGESLFDLAYGLGVPLDTLLLLNPEHALVLADGAPIRVPGRFATLTYVIKPGDSLSRIAEAHQMSLRELVAANPGSGDVIQIGKTLQIPSAVRPKEAQLPLVIAQGAASVYPDRFVGRLMASGAEYDATRFLMAHPTLPFGTIVLIENPENGNSTFAEVADRMPISSQYVVEVSEAVADALGLEDGPIDIRIIQAGGTH